ncbi:MAG: translocation/assembly module TamB domain-containing protein [Alcanivoracaceae bacterium]|nr:translocation/assembly module TamB domain-containing protein [Alcanivoracaceae bacterium]
MRRLLLTVLVLLIAIQLVMAALLGTEPGSRWLIYRLLPLVPGNLQIDQINGTVLDGFFVSNLEFQNNDLSVQLAQAEIAIDTGELWQGWLSARHLRIDGMLINLPELEPGSDNKFVLPDTLALPFGIAITSARLSDLQLDRNHQQLLKIGAVELDEAFIRGQLNIDRLSVNQQQHQAILSDVHIDLAMPYPVDARLRWQSELARVSSWLGSEKLAGNARIGGSLIDLSVSHHLSAPQIIDSQIEVAPFSAKHDFSSQHKWKSLSISLPQKQVVELSSGELQLDSDDSVVRLTSETHINLPDVIDGQLEASASGDWQRATSLNVKLTGDDGALEISGTTRWLPGINFNLTTEGREISPAILDQRLPGRINVSGKLSGQRDDTDKWQIVADSFRITGLLNDRPIEATLRAAMSDSALSLNGEAAYDKNRVSIDGHINQTLDIHSHVQLLNPQSFHPDLRGVADVYLHLSGSRSEPLLDIDASSSRMGFSQYTIEDVEIHGRQLGLLSDQMQLSATSNDILYYNRSLLNSTEIQFQGSHDKHVLSWSLHQQAAQLFGTVRGGMKNIAAGWNGTLDQLTLLLSDFPDWQLNSPTALSLSAKQQLLEKTCLSNGDGQACIEGSSTAEQLGVNLAISALPLAPFSALLGPGISVSGELEHRSDINRDSNGGWHGSLHSTLNGTTISFDDGPVDYPLLLEGAEVSATLKQEKIDAEASVVMSEHGYLQASLSTAMPTDAALKGRLDVAITELRWLELLIPGIRQRSGNLTGDLILSGQRNAPQLHGLLTLKDGETDVAEAGLTLKNISAELKAEGKHIGISGSAQSGPGSVDITGELDLAGGLPGELDLRISGERFQLLALPEAMVLINPSVTLKGNAQLFRLRGDIQIPEARLAPQQLPELAIRVSEDQVMVNSVKPPVESLKVDAELMLLIGKDVHFSGFGLDARLGGNLQFIQKPEKPVTLLGDLRIEEGRYRAYGQNLAIDQGVLLFQEKIDNPGLNIRAVRRIPSAQIVAGVAISGTLQNPQARLISEPGMEESEIMAWLLTGRGLAGGSESDNAMIAQALAVYGLEQGSGVTKKIGDKLGLDEIAVGSDWETSDASLMLGKQISDRLYLRYAIGLFDAVSTVMLRYTLSRRLHLEAQSDSNRQSLDLIYQVER